jgi:RND family efflux transporter MFP subunit
MRIIYLILLLTLIGCSKPVVITQEVIRPIAWTKVELSALEQIRTLSGVVASVETADLSFEVHGKVQEVKVNLGSEVKKGHILASLNKRSFNLALQSSQAEVEQAKASMVEAKNKYFRYEKLINQNLISQSEFDNAKALYQSSKSAVDVTLAKLDIARKDLQDSVLLAPYDGIITKRLLEPSQQIASGVLVFEIEGNHGLEVQVMVPETLIQKLKQDSFIKVMIPTLPSVILQGQITEIGTRAETANAFPVTIVIQEKNAQLRAGMTAEVEFVFVGRGRTGFTGQSIVVPISALNAELNQRISVFVFDEQTQVVRKRMVQTEDVMNNKVYISTGLKEGEIIAISGVAFLRDGQKVTLLDKQVQRFN